jgi:hypothetical protein
LPASIVQFTPVPAGKLSVTFSPVAIVSLLFVRVTVKAICNPALTLAASAVLAMETFGGTVGVGVGVGVKVAEGIGLGVNVAVGVAVGVGVSVAVGVGAGVPVGVGVGVLPGALTSIGRVSETVFPLLSVTVM